MPPSAAAQALIDRLATEDREGAVELLANTPLDDQDTAVCHALEHGWDAMAALVIQRNPDLVQDHHAISPWKLRPCQKLLWLLTWAKGNRQSAEVLLASQKPLPPQWDCLGMTLKAGWEDLLEPMAARLDDLQRLESHGLAEAIRLGHRAAFAKLTRYLEVTTQHPLTALACNRPEWADQLWARFDPAQIEDHLKSGIQERDGTPKASPVWSWSTVDAVVCRLAPERQAIWQGWAADHGLDLPQLRAQQRQQALAGVASGSGRPRTRS